MAINKTPKIVNHLTKGRAYTCWTTFTNDGVRGFREVTFVASRDQEVEKFTPRGGDRIPQDRVFHTHSNFGSVPILVVAGSIREVK
ncbi:hypothetical protein ISF9_090 [Microbacterium phage vB_MoxS-ISF9]|uniref:Uncharacterized protein n=1 Tax=Microbacterium phage vB_MoxS-ISF9 TaxID=1458670 RepID=W8NNN6_9CAUD|nr:hypothetical protein ISF9_090 [Microbacterium phage vB_MoxS-ISF9]AHL18560.1 hypothetical protein ISF9_090 [Microbacterium phage vB_MoxS-ISF9]